MVIPEIDGTAELVLKYSIGSAFVRNDAKVFRFCTSKYVCRQLSSALCLIISVTDAIKISSEASMSYCIDDN